MTEETLVACPECHSWPMPLNLRAGEIEYVCKKCGHRETRSVRTAQPHTESA
jgi:DNA-directed RNA polymerase subunit RPC12/RpoP